MKKLTASLFAALLALSIGGHAYAELDVKTVGSNGDKPTVTKERYRTVTATIEAIDLDKRIVTLKGDLDRIFDVKVGPQAKNLAQLKKGDLVTVKYYEAISAKVYKAGEAPVINEQTSAVEMAKAGAKPGGVAAMQSTITATIEAIDKKNPKKPTVTLKSVEGKTVIVKIQDPKLLKNVKVGDEVVITYSEAMAISVDKAKNKSK